MIEFFLSDFTEHLTSQSAVTTKVADRIFKLIPSSGAPSHVVRFVEFIQFSLQPGKTAKDCSIRDTYA